MMHSKPLVSTGAVVQIDDRRFVIVPGYTDDFYISGTGYLCCRSPMIMSLSETPVLPYTVVIGCPPISRIGTIGVRLQPGQSLIELKAPLNS